MECSITCDGTPIGTASIAPLAGLAHAELDVLPLYDAIRYHALEAGGRLRGRLGWNAADGDFAEEFARSWGGGRLAVSDTSGQELGVASVMIIDWETATIATRPRVVVDVRPDMARVEAFLRTLGRDDDGRARGR